MLKSEDYFQKTLSLNTKHALAHFGLGNIFLESNQIQSAISEYKMALKINPDHMPSYANMGNAQMELGKLDRARKTYETALLKNPAHAGIHRSLGIIFFEKNKNSDKAILHFQESIRLAPNQPEVEQIQSLIEALKRHSQKSG